MLQVFPCYLFLHGQYHSLHMGSGAPPAEQRQRTAGINTSDTINSRSFQAIKLSTQSLSVVVQKAGFLGKPPPAG